MSERRGVLSAGSFCVDFNKSIARWPDEDTSNEVLAVDRQGGGAGFNMALDLKRLDPELPVEAMGLVGDDELARFLFGECDARGVDRTALRAAPGGATMSVDAFNVAANGRRTHFYHQGVAAEMTPDDFDFSSTAARILHLGLPGAHKAMDLPWRGDANGWVAVLRKARAAGLGANLELMTTKAERLAELGRPCLPHLDWIIVNDYEIGALAGRETRRADGSTDPAAVARAPSREPELELHVGRYSGGVEVARRLRDPDVLAELSMARGDGLALVGPTPDDLVGPIPPEWIVERGHHWLTRWLSLTDDTDNAAFMVLTACRM